jgi:small neutral amino acid transporter SnatA (MarC family)
VGGLILLLFGLRMVLTEEHEQHSDSETDASALAVYPLAVPLLASPMGAASLAPY